MTPPGSNGATIGQLAAEWRQRLQHGERPELDDYLARYPELAEEIRELFPAVVVMEELKGDAGDLTGSVAAETLAVRERTLERLGDYRILREVGRGGMGIVYEAEQESLGRRVALKVLPSHALLDPRYHPRFQREAKAAAKLHHTNIVPVFGVGEHEGTCYYVMQFIAGLGLDKVLMELKQRASGVASAPRVPPLPPTQSYHAAADLSALDVAQSLMGANRAASVSEPVDAPLPNGRGSELLSESGRHYWQSVARLGIQVAEALDYAASQGILHRDIKPSNLLLDTRGNVWVADFGLAKASAEENLTHTGDVIGTLRYMAPERFEGHSDLRGDIYSLGLTLYEMLTLQPAFGEKDRGKLIHQVTMEEPPPPRKIDSRIPRDLETIVLKAIARDPRHRYQTGAELATDLQRFVEDRPILARRVSARERFWRWCRRNPVLASLSAALFLVMLVGLIGVTTQWRRAERALDAAETTSDKLRNVLYASDMNLVQAAWETGNISRAVRLLERHRPHPGETDVRGFEWYYWQRQCHAELSIVEIPELRSSVNLLGVSFLIYGGSFDRDGGRMAAAVRADGESYDVRIWDAVGKERFVLPGLHLNGTLPVKLSPDGSRLLVRVIRPGKDFIEEVKVWDIRGRKEILSIPRRYEPRYSFNSEVAFSADGKRLAVAIPGNNPDKLEEGNRVTVWDVESGKELYARSTVQPVTHLAFSADGSRLVVAAVVFEIVYRARKGSIRIWDAANGKEQKVIPLADETIPEALAFSPDGTRLVACLGTILGRYSCALHAWDAGSGKILFTSPVPAFTAHFGLRFSPDGKLLALWTPFDSMVVLMDPASGKAIRTLRGHGQSIFDVAFSRDGRRLSTASIDGTIRTWAVPHRVDDPRTKPAPWPMAIARDGSRFAVIPSGFATKELHILDQNGEKTASLTMLLGYPSGADFSPDGRFLAAAWKLEEGKKGYALKSRNVVTGEKRLDIAMRQGMELRGTAFSPDGRHIAAGFGVRDPANRSRYLTAGVKMWDADDGEEVLSLEKSSASLPAAIAFSPDGGRIAVAFQGIPADVRIWDVATRQEILALQATAGLVHALKFSPDGRILLGGCWGTKDSSVARAWDAETGKELFTLTGHSGVIRHFAYSPDGRRIASVSRKPYAGGSELKLWDAGSGQELMSFVSEDRIWLFAAFSGDGRRMMALGGPSLAEIVKVWDATPRPERKIPSRDR